MCVWVYDTNTDFIIQYAAWRKVWIIRHKKLSEICRQVELVPNALCNRLHFFFKWMCNNQQVIPNERNKQFSLDSTPCVFDLEHAFRRKPPATVKYGERLSSHVVPPVRPGHVPMYAKINIMRRMGTVQWDKNMTESWFLSSWELSGFNWYCTFMFSRCDRYFYNPRCC